MYILRLEVQQHVSALYVHHQVFSFPLRFCYINCDVEISHTIIILVCLCIGGYYTTLIYIYILSLLVGGGFPYTTVMTLLKTIVLPSDCLKREATKINRDVKYLRFKWHDKHIGAVRGV